MSDCDEHFSIFPRRNPLQISNTISCDSMNTYDMEEDNLSEKQTKLLMMHHNYGDGRAVNGNYAVKYMDKLDVVALDPISISPSLKKPKQTLNLQQTFTFPPNFGKVLTPANEHSTQTTESLLELDHRTKTLLKPKPTLRSFSDDSSEEYEHEQSSGESKSDPAVDELKQTHNLEKKEPFILPAINNTNRPGIDMIKKIFEPPSPKKQPPKHSATLQITPRKMSKPLVRKIVTPVSISAHDSPESQSPKIAGAIESPKIEEDDSEPIERNHQITLSTVIYRLNDGFWKSSLQGLRELLFIAPRIHWDECERETACINRKVIELFRSPRSMVCRAACQAAGELFRIAKCTKRPEFDDIVDNLLCKTGDSNRFIQKDANIALDKMVSYIPPFHAVRVLTARGPIHKSSMVRTATSRLLVCVCALTGADNILGVNGNCHTRKRFMCSLAKFLTDKNQETRNFSERLYRMLKKHKFFEEYFFKDLEPKDKGQFKRVLLAVDRKFD